jgi:hypothetical protein
LGLFKEGGSWTSGWGWGYPDLKVAHKDDRMVGRVHGVKDRTFMWQRGERVENLTTCNNFQ